MTSTSKLTILLWAFVAPEAELFDAQGTKIGKHYGAIPWLLLSAKSEGPAGSFSEVSMVQRLNTVGGAAPASACAQANAGATERVAYTADYVLFAPK